MPQTAALFKSVARQAQSSSDEWNYGRRRFHRYPSTRVHHHLSLVPLRTSSTTASPPHRSSMTVIVDPRRRLDLRHVPGAPRIPLSPKPRTPMLTNSARIGVRSVAASLSSYTNRTHFLVRETINQRFISVDSRSIHSGGLRSKNSWLQERKD